MNFEVLSTANAEQYIAYLKKAFSDEPDMMWIDDVDT